MSYDPLVKVVEEELYVLAQESARNWQDIRWLAWVGDCFDGGDYDGEFETLRYRLGVVRDRLGDENAKSRPRTAYWLIEACQAVLDGERAKELAGQEKTGNLRTGMRE